MRTPEIDTVAIWQAISEDGINVRSYSKYNYMKNGIVLSAESSGLVCRYAKNYSHKGNKFCLLMISLERDSKKIEKFFDDSVEKIIKKYDKDISKKTKLLVTNIKYSN